MTIRAQSPNRPEARIGPPPPTFVRFNPDIESPMKLRQVARAETSSSFPW
ncbi:hypothetical protein RE6C_04844 [Rhodopirellula europaea 6C]|uniref:Uncharacterized protein n=1 Tax=Rhodopirellula europaea 6C TaxID=1263867 RepID=M2ANX8_9BACT|nr:hypothetical protein RE6C_04844 [Rhodopirellula europaea 6C]